MTKPEIETIVAKAIKTERAVERLKDDLKTLKAQLVAEAYRHEDEFEETEGGGSSWVAQGKGGQIARVIFPGRKLKSSFDPEAKVFAKVRESAGKFFATLFKAKTVYVPADQFRDLAKKELGGRGAALIKMCESDSAPAVSFEVAEKAS